MNRNLGISLLVSVTMNTLYDKEVLYETID
jgi:hypothetical protein